MERTRLNGNISTAREAGKLFHSMYYLARASYANLQHAEFYQEYPLKTDPIDLKLPCITYGISKKVPDMKVKPRIMEESRDANLEAHTVTRSSIRYTATVNFDVWAASNEMADMIMEELEEFILTFQGAFNGSGLYDMRYKGLELAKSEDWKDQVAHRRIQYDIGLEKILESSNKTIEEIIKKINATNEII